MIDIILSDDGRETRWTPKIGVGGRQRKGCREKNRLSRLVGGGGVGGGGGGGGGVGVGHGSGWRGKFRRVRFRIHENKRALFYIQPKIRAVEGLNGSVTWQKVCYEFYSVGWEEGVNLNIVPQKREDTTGKKCT